MPKSKELVSSSGSDSDSSDSEPKTKKRKYEEKATKKPKPSGGTQEVSFQIADMRFVSVNVFRGKKYVNIREFYEKNGQLLPGRKGIALNEDQWKRLKGFQEEIDQALKDL